MRHLTREPIDELAVAKSIAWDGAGAVLTFAGTVRDNHLGKDVVAIDYHAYDEMAEGQIARIEAEIAERWPDVRVAIVHRVGHLALGAVSVFLAVASPHRAAGFEALRFGIDTIKERVPIWKREVYADGQEAWLEGS